MYIKVGALRYGSLHLGYAERKGSSPTNADRPTDRCASERALIQLTRVHSYTEDRHSVRLVYISVHTYTYKRGTANVATGYEDVHALKAIVTHTRDEKKILLKYTYVTG